MKPSSQPSPSSSARERLVIRAGGTVAAAAMLLAAMILVSRVTGIVRMAVIAHLFGQTPQTDCYVGAFNIPDFIYFLISGGALATGFVPVFTEYLTQDQPDAARRTFRAMLTLLVLCLLVVISLCWLMAPQLVYAIFPGWRDKPEMLALTVKLTRIVLPAQFFFVLGGLFSGTLNSLRHFFVPALQPIVYNGGIILGGVLLGPRLGVAGLSWGALFGAALGCFAFQVPLLAFKGLSFRPLPDVRDPGVRKVVSLVLPIILGLSISQITAILLPRSLASVLTGGSTTALEYANRLMQMPVAVFASGMAIALLPSLSALVSTGRVHEVQHSVAVALRAVLLLTMPAAVLLVVLRIPIIELLLEHGDFHHGDTLAVAQALVCYSLAIPAMGVQQVVSRGFYALQDTRTPVYIGIGSIAVWCIASHFLVVPLKHGGLALSSGIAALVNASLLVTMLARKLSGLEGRACWRTGVCCAVAAALCGGVAHLAGGGLTPWLPGEGLAARLAGVFGPLTAGVLAYALLLWLFQVPETALVWDRVRRRVGFRAGP